MKIKAEINALNITTSTLSQNWLLLNEQKQNHKTSQEIYTAGRLKEQLILTVNTTVRKQ